MAAETLNTDEREAALAQIDREYLGIKRMLLIGLVAVMGLCAALIFTRPGGYMVMVTLLLVIEGVGYVMLTRSLDKRREERIAELDSGRS